jgi:hypothetical protein
MGCQTLSWKQASFSTICFCPGMTYLNLLESVCMIPNFPFPCECRPFGSATILGGYDRDGPQLYMIEPSGVAYRYFGAAIGKGRQAAKTAIEKLKLSEMTCREGIIAVAKMYVTSLLCCSVSHLPGKVSCLLHGKEGEE